MLVEVARKAYLASMVPVIVNSILNEHQIVVDIVAFVNKGDFPRSRLGEKQRGKILAGWVSRKLRTMAQFGIRDHDREALGPAGATLADQAAGHAIATAEDQNRASLGSFRSASGGLIGPGGAGSSLRKMEPAPQIIEHHALDQYPPQYQPHPEGEAMDTMNLATPTAAPGASPSPVEMPADLDNEQTPTRAHAAQTQPDFGLPTFDEQQPGSSGTTTTPSGIGMAISPAHAPPPPPPPSHSPPQIRLPGVDGRESLDDWNLRPGSKGGASGAGAGTGAGGADGDGDDEDDAWKADAYMSMNLAGTLGGK